MPNPKQEWCCSHVHSTVPPPRPPEVLLTISCHHRRSTFERQTHVHPAGACRSCNKRRLRLRLRDETQTMLLLISPRRRKTGGETFPLEFFFFFKTSLEPTSKPLKCFARLKEKVGQISLRRHLGGCRTSWAQSDSFPRQSGSRCAPRAPLRSRCQNRGWLAGWARRYFFRRLMTAQPTLD